MRAKRRMSVAEFETVRPLLKTISDDRIQAARLALVDGQTLRSVGDQFGWVRQSVNDAVGVVWKTFESYRESQRAAANAGALLPPGWEQVTLIVPSHLIAKIRGEIAQALPQPVPVPATKRKPDAVRRRASKST